MIKFKAMCIGMMVQRDQNGHLPVIVFQILILAIHECCCTMVKQTHWETPLTKFKGAVGTCKILA